MKYKEKNLRTKIWYYLIIFSIAILSFLWLFQVVFLNSYYEFVKTNQVINTAKEISANYKEKNFIEILDSITYEDGICIEIINENDELYSSNSIGRGCFGKKSDDETYLKYRSEILSSSDSKIYKLFNPKFGNKTIMYGTKLENGYYIIVNASVQPLFSTINILSSQLIIVTIFTLIISLFIGYYISKRISKPIANLTETAKEMAKGNHDIEFKSTTGINEINDLADTLNMANKELAKTDELRRELMANVSHDLKTPLTMIKAYAEMIRDLTYANEEKRNSNLNTIIEETDRLNLLVNDVLEVSKMQANVIELKLETFDLNELIDGVIKHFSYLENDGYIIEYNGLKNATVKADKKKIEQVIYNLVGNATNYTGDDKKVIVKLKEEKDKYLVEIIDHGNGISPEDLDIIWNKYRRIDKKHKRNIIGTGLGLSIVKEVFNLHKLEYGVESEKNKGTTFYFKIKKEK